MRIAATADIHSPTYFELFRKSLQKVKRPDLFLLAGDICAAGHKEQYKNVIEAVRKKIDCPIVACFGNTEFEQDYEKIKEIAPEVIFLVDEPLVLERKNIGIVGTKGCLDQPTYWQKKNIAGIEMIYKQRFEKVSALLKNMKAEIKILLMHYSPTHLTLKGEKPFAYGSLAYKKFERVIAETKPSLVIHAHAHHGTQQAFIDSVPIFNVSLPANNRIVEIDLSNLPKAGLKNFM